jgi:hypothetical protein
MSRAFVKEGEDQWLPDVAPTLTALTHYLTRQNNGVRVYLKKEMTDATGRAQYAMSDGLTYTLDKEGKWTNL